VETQAVAAAMHYGLDPRRPQPPKPRILGGPKKK
jgi:hypothetical protein